ncbi:MAG: hypothetical protein EB060_12605 [Proteobacteria bacterium]|nr:hypothetical protein [Pseudomonadota bacterium]
MQDITPATPASVQMIQSYGPAGFRIAGVDYAGSVLITALSTTNVTVTELNALSIDDFNRLWTLDPPLEVLLVGTGATHDVLDPSLRTALKAHGVGVDAMATGAAARTFNVLLSEERRVATLLLLPLAH